jgi:hypothetical protein
LFARQQKKFENGKAGIASNKVMGPNKVRQLLECETVQYARIAIIIF